MNLQALIDFTGGAATKHLMPETDEDEDAETLWSEMLRAHKRGVLQAVMPADPDNGSVRRSHILRGRHCGVWGSHRGIPPSRRLHASCLAHDPNAALQGHTACTHVACR